MPLEVDYLPIATAGGANVDSQADFVGSGYQTVGFQAGLAQSKQLNKAWRQSSMMAAALANFIANTLGINVLDDGNISALVTNLTEAILSASLKNLNVTPVTVNAAVTTNQNLMNYVVPAGSMNAVGKTISLVAFGKITGGVAAEHMVIQALIPSSGGGPFLEGLVGGGAAPTLGWRMDAEIITVTAGASGHLLVSAAMSLDSSTDVTIQNNGARSTVVLGVDLTAAFTIQFVASFDSGSTANIAEQDALIVEALN